MSLRLNVVTCDRARRNRRSAAGMVMRAAKPLQRMPVAKLLGASTGFAEPHGHVGRQHRRYARRVGPQDGQEIDVE
jgi:hypothetical protein